MQHRNMTLATLALLAVSGPLFPAAAWSQTATNVKCNRCVDAGDIANAAAAKRAIKKGAVVRSRIAKDAVDAARLADGAVTTVKIGTDAVGPAKLQDGAVDGAKFAPGAVTGDRIQDGAVTEMKLAPGAVTGAAIAEGTVTAAELAAGAVTGAKLANDAVTEPAIMDGEIDTTALAPGSVTADKFDPAVLAGNGLQLLRTVVVNPAGPTAADNCDELRAALADITDASATNPYLIRLEAGVYDCGANTVDMEPFIDIEGAGEGATILRGSDSLSGVVAGASDAELRFLSVEYNAAGINATAIDTRNTNVRLTHVTAHATSTSGEAFAINVRGSPLLSHVTATADSAASTAAGILVRSDGIRLVQVTAAGTGATSQKYGLLIQTAGTTSARNSVFTGSPAIQVAGSATMETVNLSATQLNGGRNALGTFHCVGAYDGTFAKLDADCM